jgi:hypothetical protein
MKHILHLQFIRLLPAVVLIISCLSDSSSDYPAEVRRALNAAGGNRGELEKVLLHYRKGFEEKVQKTSDASLKLRAAGFLIANMPGHYSHENTAFITGYYNALEKILTQGRGERQDSLYLSLCRQYAAVWDPDTLEDIHVIKADYLIAGIDRSFHIWRQSEWAQHLGFDDFCEYILPYKVAEWQSLDNWKEYLVSYGDTLTLNRLHYCKPFQNSAFMACRTLNLWLTDTMKRVISLEASSFIPIRRMSTLAKIHTGACRDYNVLASALMRAHGIPAIIDFIPQWPHRSSGHSWNVLLDTSGKPVPFEGAGEEREKTEASIEYAPTGKIYRDTYARNREAEEVLRAEKYLRNTFVTPFIRDVTAEYQQTVDIDVPVTDRKGHEYAFLSVFNNASWRPVCWGKIKNGKARFKEMGRRTVYMTVLCEEKGTEPLGYPVLVSVSGEIHTLRADTAYRQTLVLNRKYPPSEMQYYVADRIVGGQIQVADNPLFRNPRTLHTITKFGVLPDEMDFSRMPERFRYWRYFSPQGAYGNIAELMFYEEGSRTPLKGRILGTAGSSRKGYGKESVFDGDVLTYFDAPQPDGCWVGMDFGRPVHISRILYWPRNDGNSVEPGDEYELFYWDSGTWQSLGRKRADGITLRYHDCPTNALFLLHDHTKGAEERIFTYENGTQVWY